MRSRSRNYLRALALVIVMGGVTLMLVAMIDTLFQVSQDCVTDYDLVVCYSSSSLPAWAQLGWLPALILGGLLFVAAGSKPPNQ